MKKFTKTVSTLLFGLSLFSTTSMHADDLDRLMKIYDKIPNAQYHLMICPASGKCYRTTVDSCAGALMDAKMELKNGAKEVTISSTYPSVHKSCYDKTYTSASQLPF